MTEEKETLHSASLETHPWSLGYCKLLDRLNSEGFRVEYCGGACPVQIGGWLPTGEYFHFRSRGHQVSLEIWWENFEPKEPHMGWCPEAKANFYLIRRPYDWPDGGWASAHVSNKHFRRLLRAYREWKKNPVPLPKPKKQREMRKFYHLMKKMRRKERKCAKGS